MNLQSDIRPISYVKSNAAEMLRQVNESHRPIVITQNGEATAVLLDTTSFQEMKDALGFMKLISQSEHDFQHEKTMSHDEAMAVVRNRIRAHQ
ncbi:MAG: type II toxin-antitoxin system Phd/YefM family antitoxin [Spirochaeta sp.]|jgi:prevent-host-death family protein|nr:type II toxin-antitoxin system Phd/YefM family antitoxin [Spirochaeta sp.]